MIEENVRKKLSVYDDKIDNKLDFNFNRKTSNFLFLFLCGKKYSTALLYNNCMIGSKDEKNNIFEE